MYLFTNLRLIHRDNFELIYKRWVSPHPVVAGPNPTHLFFFFPPVRIIHMLIRIGPLAILLDFFFFGKILLLDFKSARTTHSLQKYLKKTEREHLKLLYISAVC